MADESEKNVDESTSSTLFVGNVPNDVSQHELEELFSDVGPIKKCHLAQGESRGFAYITYALREDAEEAIEKIKTIKGHALRIKFSKSNQPSENKVHRNRSRFDKRARVIVRNIPFKITDDELKSAFEQMGPVEEVVIPKKPDGKMLGFAFIQYQNIFFATKAVKRMNGRKLLDRPIAVDWTIPKDRYKSLKKQPEQNKELKENSDCDESEDEETENKKEQLKAKKRKHQDEEEEEIESSNDTEDSIKAKDEDDTNSEEDEDNDDDSEGDEDNDDHDSEGDEEDCDSNSSKKKFKNPNQNRPRASDTNDGCTLFIRNLSFDTTQENLKETLSVFGHLKYVLLCIDPDTEHPKGTAFARFFQKDSAEKCLAKASDESKDGGIIMDGRRLIVNKALSREEIHQMANEKHKKEPKDKRNLYLSREGLVRPGTQAAEGLSQHDIDARLKVEAWKRRMLKNLDIFVSKVRLCVRNLPLSVDDDKLRKIYQTAAGPGAIITEARIMKDYRQGRPPNYVSKGFGFVRFTTHEAALAALRNTNNNPAIFAKDRRPIVEFSLESKKAIQAQQKRLEKSREKLMTMNQTKKIPETKKDNGKIMTAHYKPNKKFKHEAKQINANQNQAPVPGFIGTIANKDKKVLPSHIGAKVRHKARNSGSKPSKKPKISRKQLYGKYLTKNQPTETKSQKRLPNKKRKSLPKEEARLRKLETSRARKIRKMEKKLHEKKKSKWFEK